MNKNSFFVFAIAALLVPCAYAEEVAGGSVANLINEDSKESGLTKVVPAISEQLASAAGAVREFVSPVAKKAPAVAEEVTTTAATEAAEVAKVAAKAADAATEAAAKATTEAAQEGLKEAAQKAVTNEETKKETVSLLSRCLKSTTNMGLFLVAMINPGSYWSCAKNVWKAEGLKASFGEFANHKPVLAGLTVGTAALAATAYYYKEEIKNYFNDEVVEVVA